MPRRSLGGWVDLRDYLRMLRRGWITIFLVTALGFAAASIYLSLTPKTYGATTVLFVSASAPETITDLQQGTSFSSNAVVTYAQIIDSATILGPAAEQLRPQRSVDELLGSVSSNVRVETTLIDIGVTTSDPRSAAVIANAVADSAARILPTLQMTPAGRPLVRVEQIRPAVEPLEPSSPNTPRILVVGLVVGFFLGLGGTIVRESLDTRLRRSTDIAPLTSIPLVAVVPPVPKYARGGLVARDDPRSVVGEAYRTLRTNLGSVTAREPRSLVFAPVAVGQDGVQVPANLAWALAQTGRRVLLVDGDMRSSDVGELFGIETGSGLAEALTAKDGNPGTHATENPYLRVLLSGGTASAPSDLLSSPAMTQTLRRLEQEYDIVLLRMPPVLEYADTAVVAASTGGTFITVGAGRTRAADLTTALDALANVRVRPLGIVLTDGELKDRATRSGTGAAMPSAVSGLDSPTLRQEPVRPSSRSRQGFRVMRPRSATHASWPE